MVDHRQLAAVLRADLSRVALVDDALCEGIHCIGRPDEMVALPRVVVTGGPLFGRVERFVRVELVDEQHERLALRAVVRCVLGQPPCGCLHRARAGEVLLAAEPSSAVVVVRVPAPVGRGAQPRLVGTCLPRVALMAAFVLPRTEVGVVVLTTHLEQVRVVGDQLCHHT